MVMNNNHYILFVSPGNIDQFIWMNFYLTLNEKYKGWIDLEELSNELKQYNGKFGYFNTSSESIVMFETLEDLVYFKLRWI
jgi:hypothetical protein